MKTQAISKAFKEQTEKLSKEFSDVYYNYETMNKQDVATITTNMSKVEFIYTTKYSFLVPGSTVFVRVYPIKTTVVFFHLYELMDENDLRCTYIANIESARKMEIAINYLGDILKQYLPEIENLVLDGDKYDALVLEKKELVLQKYTKGKRNLSDYVDKDFMKKYDLDYDEYYREHGEYREISWDDIKKIIFYGEYDDELFKAHLDYYEQFCQLLAYTNNEAYRCFVMGKYAKSLKRYNKCKDLSEYEKRLCLYMTGELKCDYKILPPELVSSISQNKFKYENQVLFKTLPYTISVSAVVLSIICFGTHLIYTSGSVINSFSIWFLCFAVVCSFTVGLFFSMAFRKWLLKFIVKDKEEYKALLEKDALYDNKFTNILSVAVVCIVIAVSICSCVLLPLSQPLLYEDRIVYDDGEAFPLLNPKDYYFDDLTGVYYINGRYNDFGDYIDRSSYILCYSDGSYIDSDCSFSNEQVEEYILPILDFEKSDIKVLKSDRDFEKLIFESVQN